MSGRVYVAPQAGRADRSAQGPEPWGSTASQAFRAYEAAELRSCRGTPAALAPALAPPPGATASTPGSSCGRSARGGRGASAHGQWPAQAPASQPGQAGQLPYRDSFAPRSQRWLYELAHARSSRDDARSSAAGSLSCFTVASSAARSRGGHSSATHSASEPNILTLPELSRLPTADSQKLPGGLARRRKEAQLKAPAQWAPDRAWFHERLQEDGPAGMMSANHVASMCSLSLTKHGERINSVNAILNGDQETEPRARPGV